MYSSPAGGNRFPFLGFLMWKGCWSHVKEETSYRLKNGKKKKKIGFSSWVWAFCFRVSFEAKAALAGEGVCQMHRAF